MRAAGLVTSVLLALATGTPGCGHGPDAPDLPGYEIVYRRAMKAVADRDLAALWPLLTADGRDRVEHSLRTWQAQLRDPDKRAYALRLLRQRHIEVTDAELERAGRGTLEQAWTFFLRADPRPPDPPRRGIKVDPHGRSVQIEYQAPSGDLRTVRLVQTGAGWFVDDLQL